MKYVRFRDSAGYVRWGSLKGTHIIFGKETYPLEETDILPPSQPTKILCIGLNYSDHAEETGKEIPDRPLLFLKTPNTLVGHKDAITLPEGKERVDYEAELAVIIGRQCRNVSPERAMDVVKGFTCFNDVSNRDDQRKETNWVRGKAFDNAGPMGPVLATPEEVPKDARIRLLLNGEEQQASSRDQLIFSIPELIAEITKYMTLEPGDAIATGTPSGIGPLHDGDTVKVEIEGIGTLINYVRAKKQKKAAKR